MTKPMLVVVPKGHSYSIGLLMLQGELGTGSLLESPLNKHPKVILIIFLIKPP